MKKSNPAEQESEALLNAKKIKAVITDLDNTLWSGILAEKQKLTLNKRYYRYLISLYDKGLQIMVVSKNDESEVLRTFRRLKINENLFTLVISNWDPKYQNVDRIIRQLNLRPETVIFVDDNQLELDEVKKNNPLIHRLEAKDWGSLIDVTCLKGKSVEPKAEILQRINRYRTSFLSGQLSKKYSEDTNFLRSLKRELNIGVIANDNLDRFTNLLVVTHRLNFNPGKFKEYSWALDYLFKKINSGYELYAISTKENGVSLGLTGAFVVKADSKIAIIEDGTFSCGIIGRGFEQKSILALMDIMKKRRVSELHAVVSDTSTNIRIKEIFEELGFTPKRLPHGKTIFSVRLSGYKPKTNFNWVKVLSGPPEMDYFGIPSVIGFFVKTVKPRIKKGFRVINLGSARGEVLGLLQEDARKNFLDYIKKNRLKYTKLDLEGYRGEKNLIGNAEDMQGIVKDESQNMVMAIELLEHTENFWKAINEMIRICRVRGYLFITVPCFRYPKHEYPIDKWRIGPKTLSGLFPKTHFRVVRLETEGSKKTPRRTMILVQKIKSFLADYSMPDNGKTDWKTGLTVFE